MMDFNLEKLKAETEQKLTSIAQHSFAAAPKFSALDSLTKNLKFSHSSFLTTLSVPRYTDEVSKEGLLIITENFQD